jgi:hypothetical protein
MAHVLRTLLIVPLRPTPPLAIRRRSSDQQPMKLRRIVDMEFFDGIAADHADHAISSVMQKSSKESIAR